eukprot:CAMPEP_0206001456 /NCGR_PEP_ID=MMETSP1464-20131121/2124_1 /ASSEMBLY_ACC=CAM_ASM_001124 /TAXON_ID=119497 /ORGANISM="Exanthemachrysis gayraliae, Strain RCC1523" /LENGTH=96 /DNA_ID=CAMNT_0053374771 /DNA_START=421 /DNA_END=711 /DNA_ORIENTATION=+
MAEPRPCAAALCYKSNFCLTTVPPALACFSSAARLASAAACFARIFSASNSLVFRLLFPSLAYFSLRASARARSVSRWLPPARRDKDRATSVTWCP